MNPTYQQAMVQALMGGRNMAPGMGGQNASTPYGAAFMTGNQSMPQYMQQGQQPQQQGQGMLGQGPSNMLQQPMATYS